MGWGILQIYFEQWTVQQEEDFCPETHFFPATAHHYFESLLCVRNHYALYMD